MTARRPARAGSEVGKGVEDARVTGGLGRAVRVIDGLLGEDFEVANVGRVPYLRHDRRGHLPAGGCGCGRVC